MDSVKYKTLLHKWLELIEARVVGDDPKVLRGKPDPIPFQLAAEKLGVSPFDCWALEDSISGMKSAINAGCFVWFYQSKISNNNPKQTKVETIDNLNRVIDTLKMYKF